MSNPLRAGIDAGFRLGWKVGLTVAADELTEALTQAVKHGATREEFGIQVTTIIERLTTLAGDAPELAVVMAGPDGVPDEILEQLGVPPGTIKH